jgi:peroxiredoxin
MSPGRPEDLLDREIPDLTLPASTGDSFRFRGVVGRGPLALFFYIRKASPR